MHVLSINPRPVGIHGLYLVSLCLSVCVLCLFVYCAYPNAAFAASIYMSRSCVAKNFRIKVLEYRSEQKL